MELRSDENLFLFAMHFQSIIKMKGIKKRLDDGEVLIGAFLSLGSGIASEIVAGAGFDWVVIDLEHGLGTEANVVEQLQGLRHAGTVAVVRVESSQRQRIHRVLDLGADGIMCPRVESAEDAGMAIRAMQYPPLGNRGVAKMIRAADYGVGFDKYFERAANELLGIIQIETLEALEHLDAIAAIPGVDVLFIGPSDLSMALGIFGQTDHPLFVATMDRIIAAAVKAEKHVGILMADPADLPKYHSLGIRLLACGTDAGFLNKSARQTASALKAAIGGPGK